MKMLDIFASVNAKLRTKFPTYKIYGEEVREGLVTPCFFVYLLPIVNTNESKYMKYKRIGIKITYMTEKKQNKEFYQVIDDLNELFGMSLSVLDRKFTITDVYSEIIDRDMHYSFDIQFYDDVVIEDYPLMQNLNTNL